MPIFVTNTAFEDEFISGTTDVLNALVGDKITATIDLYYENVYNAGTLGSSFSLTPTSTIALWLPFGTGSKQVFEIDAGAANFSPNELVGHQITVTDFNNGSLNTTYIVDSIFSSRYIVTTTPHISSTSGGKNKATLYLSSDIENVSIKSAVFNASGSSFTSPLKIANSSSLGIVNEISNDSLDASNVTPVNVPYKYDGAHQTGSITIAGAVSGVVTRQSFQLVHVFIITPISIINISQGVSILPSAYSIPYSDLNISFLFNGANTDNVYKIEPAFKINGNSTNNFVETIRFRDPSMNIQGFNQKYSGGGTNYSVSNISIILTSDSTVVGTPIVTQKFTVSFDIDNTVDDPFSDTNTLVKAGIEVLPETIDNTKDYEGAFLYDRAIQTLGAGAIAGEATGDAASITNFTATFNSTSQVSVSFDCEFTSGAQTQINTNGIPIYSIWVETQDHTLGYANADRVNLPVYIGEGISSVLVDPITFNNSQFITAPYDDFSTGIDASEIDGFPVQLLTGATVFSADWTGRPNLRIDTVNQSLVLKNSSTNEEIELDSTVIPVNTFSLISDEFPEANYSVSKGYKIPSDEIRNLIEMTNVSDVSSVRTFEVRFPFFIRWEEYTELILSSVPSSILDSNEDFDGKNYDVYRIDQLANWSLNYRISVDCEEDGTTFSQDFDSVIGTTTYDEHPDVISRTIQSYDSTGTTLQPTLSTGNQGIESASDSVIKASFLLNYTPAVIGDFEIEIYLQGFKDGSPTNIKRISSVNKNIEFNVLIDTGNGKGKVEKSINGNSVIGEALIVASRLVNLGYDSYTIFAQLYDPKRPVEFLLAENGNNLTDELGNKFIKDF